MAGADAGRSADRSADELHGKRQVESLLAAHEEVSDARTIGEQPAEFRLTLEDDSRECIPAITAAVYVGEQWIYIAGLARCPPSIPS